MNKCKFFDVSPSSFWLPCKWRITARKRLKLSIYGCFVFSSNVRQCTVWFFSRGLGKTPTLQPIVTSLSKASNFVKFVNLQNIQSVFNLSLPHDSMTSVLLRISFSFVKSLLVHKLLVNPAVYCIHVRKNIWIFLLLLCLKWIQMLDLL